MADLARKAFSFEIQRETHQGTVLINTTVTHSAIEHFCLELCLLLFEEVESVWITEPATHFTVTIRLDKDLAFDSRGIARLEEGELALRLTVNELEYWTSFF